MNKWIVLAIVIFITLAAFLAWSLCAIIETVITGLLATGILYAVCWLLDTI